MLAILLALLFIAVAIACYFSNGKDALCPSFLFCLGFAVCSLFTVANLSYWGYEMSTYAFLTLLYGVLFFAIPCVLIFLSWRRFSLSNDVAFKNYKHKIKVLPIRPVLLMAFACFQIVLIIATIIWIKDAYPASSLSESINQFNAQIVFSATPTSMPRPLGLSRSACAGFVLFAVYLTAQELVYRRWKNAMLCGLNVMLYCLMTLESGGRTGAIVTILSLGVAYLLVKRLHMPDKKLFSKKLFLICAVVILCGIALFPLSAIGRDLSTWSPFEYLSIYIGAEIPNLDIFLMQTDGGSVSHVWGEMTFVRSINYIGSKLGISEWVYALNLPFQGMGGHSLGNVYTTFYAFAYDFGYAGVIILTIVMAVFSQLVYQMALTANCKRVDVWIAVYSFVAVYLVLCFFSNKIYEEVLSLLFVRTMVFYLIGRFVYLKLPVYGIEKGKVRGEVCPNYGSGIRWYYLDLGGISGMSHISKRMKKTLVTGCVISIICAAVLGIFGFLSANGSINQTYTAYATFNVAAQTGANDSQATKATLGGVVANDLTEYLKTTEYQAQAIKAAGVSGDAVSSYAITVNHTTGTRVVSITIVGPDKQAVNNIFAAAISLAESTGKKSFNLESIEEVSTSTHEAVASSKAAPLSPKRSAALFALAGLLLGVLLTVAWRMLDPRLRSKKDAEEISGFPVVGQIDLGSDQARVN